MMTEQPPTARAVTFLHLAIAAANRAAIGQPRTLTPEPWLRERAWKHLAQARNNRLSCAVAEVLP